MSAATDGGLAFPVSDGSHTEVGMSLRDYFAGQFLAGASVEDCQLNVPSGPTESELKAARVDYWSVVAGCAYIAADAMLAAREVQS
jgi:hypothetical protein